jgi:hypothetical protein
MAAANAPWARGGEDRAEDAKVKTVRLFKQGGAVRWLLAVMLGLALPIGEAWSQPEATPTPSASAAQGEKAAEPPYARKDGTVRVFDQPQNEKLELFRHAAEQLAKEELGQAVKLRPMLPGLVTYGFQLQGADEEEILDQARVRALQSSAARIYFDNYYLLGRDLLRNYLMAGGKKFIVRTDVTDRRILANDRLELRLKLSVDLNALFRDLNEKHFIAEPNLRPLVTVHLHELVDGKPNALAEGRERVEKTLQDFLFRTRSREMRQVSLNEDLSTSPGLLALARLEAQRHNVDILITGALTVRPGNREKILFDEYSFQEAELALKMYRVDNGELLQEVTDRYSASGDTAEAAAKQVLDALVTRATRRLAETLRAVWGYVMLDMADYRLMVGGLDPERKITVLNDLKRFSPEIQVYEKAYYGNVWIVNLVLPKDQHNQLETFLRESTEPQFKVEKIDERRFRLEVL